MWDINRLKEFGPSLNDIENIWNQFKTIVQEGTRIFVPNNCKFSTWKKKRWKWPINKGTRTKIKNWNKEKTWKKFIKSKDLQDLQNYKEARNIVRNQTTRITNEEEQNQIAKDCELNLKQILNYIKSKTNSHPDEGDLSYININDEKDKVQVTEYNGKAKNFSDYF